MEEIFALPDFARGLAINDFVEQSCLKHEKWLDFDEFKVVSLARRAHLTFFELEATKDDVKTF